MHAKRERETDGVKPAANQKKRAEKFQWTEVAPVRLDRFARWAGEIIARGALAAHSEKAAPPPLISARGGTAQARPRSSREPVTSKAAPAFAPANSLTSKGQTAMGFFSKDIKKMDDLFVHTLRDIYYAEKQIVQALPEMIEKSSDAQLKQGFQSHLRETENHVKRLERVFQLQGKDPKGVDCPAIDGIIDEANEVAGEVEDKNVLDAALIAAAQAVEHYEITRYGSLIAWAKQLGRQDCATLLQQNLDEEKAADKKLTAMAENNVNRKAA
jgi:ferritin-like metal-binding protein YciE